MFFNNGSVVFFPIHDFLSFSRFTFCSCDNVSSWLLGSVSLGSLVFLFSEVGSSFSLDCFCHHLICLVLYYDFVHVFFYVFLVFQVQKTNRS